MTHASPINRPDLAGIEPADLAFHFETGRPSLNFTATVGDRSGLAYDRWRAPEDLIRWCVEAGYLAPKSATPEELTMARHLREAIYRVVVARSAGKKPKPTDIDMINDWAARPIASPQLSADAHHLSWRSKDPLNTILAEMARDAIDLLTGEDFARLRECAEHSCSVLFVDHSRPGKRRWCSMTRCGNRVKKATFRRRSAQTEKLREH